jgi:hypothetical protein
MGATEVIAFEEVRARKQWSILRQQLHTRAPVRNPVWRAGGRWRCGLRR